MIQTALIGVGYWGPNIARSLESTGRARLRWVCDKDPKRLEKIAQLYPHCRTTDSYQTILDDDELTAVLISTPVDTHFQLGKLALEAGKDVFIEKPLCRSSAEAAELIELAHSQDRILMVGHIFKFNSSIQYVKGTMQEGRLGEIRYLTLRRTNLGPIRTDVNALWDLAPHDLSILCHLLESPPLNVNAIGGTYLNQGLTDVVFATYTFPNNILGHIYVGWLEPKKIRQMTIVGSERMLVWDDINLNAPVAIFDKRVESDSAQDMLGDFIAYKTAIVDGGTFIPKINLNQPLLNELNHFLDCITTRRRPLSDGIDGLQIILALEAGEKSLATQGARVEIEDAHAYLKRYRVHH